MSDIRVELSAVAVRGEPPVKRNKRQARGLVREISKKPRLGSLLLALLATRLARPSEERCGADIECYPGIPYHRHLLWKAARYAGVKLLPYRGEGTRRVRRPRLRLYWPDTTVAVAGVPPPPECWRRGALNGGTGEESKRRVEQAFAGMFGYDLAVDPTVHEGPCVAKSDRVNGAHDGRVLLCPIAEADPALAYEVLIDNRVDEETVIDFRVPVVGGEIPFVYLKRRPMRDRFSNRNAAVTVATAGDVFSVSEREKLRAFCRVMGLDLGVELDVLRDASDGRIYVVDANWTSWGPPQPITTVDAVRAVRSYAAALTRLAERAAAAESVYKGFPF